jgi:hypothetical protein
VGDVRPPPGAFGRYRFWYVLGTVVPHCSILSVARSFANLSTRHVNANTKRHINANTNLIRHPPRCRVIVIIVVVLTLSAVHQWVGYLVVARRAILIDRGI